MNTVTGKRLKQLFYPNEHNEHDKACMEFEVCPLKLKLIIIYCFYIFHSDSNLSIISKISIWSLLYCLALPLPQPLSLL